MQIEKLIYVLLALFLLMTEGGDAQNTAHSNVSDSEQRIDAVFNILFRYPNDGAKKQTIDSLKQIAETTGDNRLLSYALFATKIRERYATQSPDEKKKLTSDMESIAEKSPFLDTKGYFFYAKGMEFFNNREYAKGLPLIFKAKKLLEQANYDNFPFASYYYYGFFNVYYYFEDYKTAAYYCEMILQKPASETYSYIGVYNNLGLCYLKQKEYDEAEQAFKLGIEECKKANNLNFEALIRGNVGNLLRLRGDYRAALPLLYEEAKLNEKAIPENAAISRMYIANSLLHLDSTAKASQFIAPPDFVMPIWTQPNYDLLRYETLALYHSKAGNFQLANRFKDSLVALKDTLKVQLDYKKIAVLESSLQAEKYVNERKILEINAQNERFRRNAVIIGLLLVFGGVVYWLVQKRKHEQILEQQKQQRSEELLAQANKQLALYLSNIKEKNDLLERVSQQLEDANNPVSTLPEAEKNKYLDSLQNSVILTEEHWVEFKTLFEQVFPNFFTNLNKNYPDLTASEIRLLALEKLNLPDKDMGNMLGISADSVKKTRYRLRKKHTALLSEQ